ncbi:hypothetical protein HO173_011049 [Letharia columbiana]|uniref:Uncharacterized protein n=1 Tax=Letharia columbiana TaxID=112416 RepID=A0A8H6FLI8_9LECA|nr:uncharacterized protein HO173_011049 [Letharia columbiana]KAF6230697.1 hypothetical protein HO173_011049 [Letharia columbiana]
MQFGDSTVQHGSVVGQIRFIKKDNSILSSSNNNNADTNSLLTALPNTHSTLLGIPATNVTSSSALSTIYHNGRLTAEIDMAGRPLSSADVFMTIFTA